MRKPRGHANAVAPVTRDIARRSSAPAAASSPAQRTSSAAARRAAGCACHRALPSACSSLVLWCSFSKRQPRAHGCRAGTFEIAPPGSSASGKLSPRVWHTRACSSSSRRATRRCSGSATRRSATGSAGPCRGGAPFASSSTAAARSLQLLPVPVRSSSARRCLSCRLCPGRPRAARPQRGASRRRTRLTATPSQGCGRAPSRPPRAAPWAARPRRRDQQRGRPPVRAPPPTGAPRGQLLSGITMTDASSGQLNIRSGRALSSYANAARASHQTPAGASMRDRHRAHRPCLRLELCLPPSLLPR